MPLPSSSLSGICSSVADFIRDGLEAVNNDIDVSIGIPADAASAKHLVNLFFYKFEPSGFVLNTRMDEPWRLKIHCLITTFGIDENSVSAGENELRMIGEILRLFHENPVLASEDIEGEKVRLQVIYNPVNEDQINQIWSTQGDTIYHPSLAYEMSLSPVMPKKLWRGDPLVGSIGSEVTFAESSSYRSFSGRISSPPVLPVTIDTSVPSWTPEICFVYQGKCFKSLVFKLDSDEFANFTPEIWLAGDKSSGVQFVWEIWGNNGWQNTGIEQTAVPFSTRIDPDDIPARGDSFPIESAFTPQPFSSESPAQYLLYAVRTYQEYAGGPQLIVKSNPLLISAYRSRN